MRDKFNQGQNLHQDAEESDRSAVSPGDDPALLELVTTAVGGDLRERVSRRVEDDVCQSQGTELPSGRRGAQLVKLLNPGADTYVRQICLDAIVT